MSPSIEFNHVHVTCHDLEATIAWYQQAFGASVVHKAPVNGHPFVRLRVGNEDICLIEYPRGAGLRSSGPRPRQVYTRYGLAHVCFKVDDLEAWLTRLTGQGIAVLSPPASALPGVRTAFILGPENVPIELLEQPSVPMRSPGDA